MREVLIFGCGYLGLPAAKAWLAQGRKVYAVTRSRKATLQQEGLLPILGDVMQPDTLQQLPPVQTVLYAVGMDRSTGFNMQQVYVEGLRTVLQAFPAVEKFIYISSTSGYAQTDGSWVNETSPTEPTQEAGKVVLEAESVLRELRPDAIILRFAGIYGPKRLLRQAAILKGEAFPGDADKWLNLIHVEDGVQAILQAERVSTSHRLFNISDGTPVTRRDFYTELSKLLNAPPAKFEPRSESVPEPNRQVSNQLARQVLGFTPKYGNYQKGLASSIGEPT